MTPYERIDQLEAIMRDLTARIQRIEKREQPQAALLSRIDAVGTEGGKASTETLHLPAKAKH